jgi:arylsulfatase A-like enzyme
MIYRALICHLLSAAFCLWLGVPAWAADAVAKRPNILLILADDLGWSDIGCYGGEIRTPNLDALAAGGLRFTQFYNCARCCPSRAALLTGLYPQQAGVGSMTADEGLPGYRGSLQPGCVTIAQVLHSAGYRTAAVGKWHVGDAILPTSRGFDDFYGFVRGYAVDSWEPRMMLRLPEGRSSRNYQPGEYFATDAITDQALDFLAEARKSSPPWFFYVAYQAPHFPLQSQKQDMADYADIYAQGWDQIRAERLTRMKQLGLLPASAALTPRSPIPMKSVAEQHGSTTADGNNPAWDSLPADRRADLAQRMAVYAGMVTGMDRNIGRLIADLRAHDELDNTLILFLSDNGACAEWEPFGFDLQGVADPRPGTGINVGTPNAPNVLHGGDDLQRLGGPGSLFSYGSGWANASNSPWRFYKHYDHEGGISAPLIVHWPARIKAAGQLRTQVGHVIDIMTTCMEIGGAKYPAELDGVQILPPEGKSLVPAFDGRPLARDFLAWEHEGNRALRAGDWKIVSLAGKPWELYDLTHDRVELNDLAAQQPERVKEMSAQWDEWAKRAHVLRSPADRVRKG